MRPAALLFPLWAFAANAAPEGDSVSRAVEALQRGDAATAEQLLRAELRAHPANTDALEILAPVLDQEKKYAEADALYRHAVASGAHSPSVWNNYGNHLMATGQLKAARAAFLKTLALDASKTNPKLQLARIAVAQQAPAEAIIFLDRLPNGEPSSPVATLVRMEALYELRRTAEADAILARLDTAGQEMEIGTALAAAGQYAKAEELFGRAAAARPDDFEAQYRLGLAASHAHDTARALAALSAAHKLTPANAEAAFDLAVVEDETGKADAALQVLAETSRAAPEEAEVLFLLARITAELGYFSDAIAVWNRYLKLKPADETAKRERAFDETALGENMIASIAALRAFVRKHPGDATGHFELGTAEMVNDQAAAGSAELDRALQIDPNLAAARVARGLLRYRAGDAAAALPDFEAAEKRQPENVTVLDRLAETYLALDRAGDAIPLLRKAVERAPDNSRVVLHLGRALAKAGQANEAAAVMARFRELGPDRSGAPRSKGLVEFLNLSEQERLARYRAGVERTMEKNPANAEALVRHLEIVLADGNAANAKAAAQKILELKPSAELLTEAADALLAAEQFDLARDFTEHAIGLAGSSPALAFDLELAKRHGSI